MDSMSTKEINQKIGQRIKELRFSKGLTQGELAEKINKTTSYVSKIEIGDRSPTIDVYYDVAKALDVHVASIVSVIDEPLLFMYQKHLESATPEKRDAAAQALDRIMELLK